MKQIQTQGVLIRKYTVGENDNFVTWYTPELGKLTTKVKGAKKITGRFMGHLEYLNLCDLSIYRGPRNLILTDCAATNTFKKLKKDFEKLESGFTLIKMLNALTYEENHIERIFRLVLDSLKMLEESSKSRFVVECFKLKLLDLFGLLPDFRHCCECAAGHSPEKPAYLGIKGNIICDKCHRPETEYYPIDFRHLKLCAFINRYHGTEIEKIAVSPGELEYFQNLIQKFIYIHFPEKIGQLA